MARVEDNSNQLAAARWAGDFFSPENLHRGGLRLDAAQFASTVYTITTTAEAAAAATSIAVSALGVAVPAGTFLQFGTNELVRVAADAALGATSLTVDALGQTVESGDTATYTVTDPTPVTVPSGTAVGRTYAERDSGDDFGPAGASDDEIYLIAFEVYDAEINPDFVGYRPNAGLIVKENYLPAFSGLASGVRTALRARYNCIRGAN